jgi:hypothetical protein
MYKLIVHAAVQGTVQVRDKARLIVLLHHRIYFEWDGQRCWVQYEAGAGSQHSY